MKKLSMVVAISGIVGLSGCGSLKFGNDNPGITPSAVIPVKDEVVELSTEWKPKALLMCGNNVMSMLLNSKRKKRWLSFYAVNRLVAAVKHKSLPRRLNEHRITQ